MRHVSLILIFLTFAIPGITQNAGATSIPTTNNIHRIEQVALQIEFQSSFSSVPVDSQKIETEIHNWLTQAGMPIVESNATNPENTYHLKFSVQTFRTRDGIFLYDIMLRCSLLSDLKLTKNESGKVQRIWFTHQFAGQKGESGFQDNLTRALRRTLLDLISRPNSPPSPEGFQKAYRAVATQEALDNEKRRQVVDFDFTQMKVRRQPPAPPYPETARVNDIQGIVVVEIEVDSAGIPIRVNALSGPPELLMTAVRYALKWQFDPPQLNGSSMPGRFKLTMPFRLHESLFPPSQR